MKILIVGDSHTGALKRGLDELVAQNKMAPDVSMEIIPLAVGARLAYPFWDPKDGFASIHDDGHGRRVTRVPPDDGTPLAAIGLSMALWQGRVMRLMADGNLSLPGQPSGRPISHAVFRQIVLADHQYILGLLAFLRGLDLPVVAIEPPAVFRDNRAVGRIGAERVLGAYRALRTIIRAELAAIAVPIVSLPADSLDDDGFMRSEFKHEDPLDPHHANPAFGKLMIARVEAWARNAQNTPV